MKQFIMASLLIGALAGVAKAADETITYDEIVVSSTVINTASPALVFSGPGTVYGVFMTTGAVTNYVALRDTDTANASSTPLVPFIVFSTTQQLPTIFPKPIRVYNGLSFNLNAAAAQNGATVFYKKGTR